MWTTVDANQSFFREGGFPIKLVRGTPPLIKC